MIGRDRRNAPSLLNSTLVGALLPIGMSLIPLATTAALNTQPFGATMFWASPDVLPFLALLGGCAGAFGYWLRRGGIERSRPSITLRMASGLALFSLVPIPIIMFPGTITPYATAFLAPNLVMIGVALAWRIARWDGYQRLVVTSLIGSIDAFWIVGMLTHAPDRHARLRSVALPAAVALFVFGLVRGRRTPTSAD